MRRWGWNQVDVVGVQGDPECQPRLPGGASSQPQSLPSDLQPSDSSHNPGLSGREKLQSAPNPWQIPRALSRSLISVPDNSLTPCCPCRLLASWPRSPSDP